MLYEIVPGLFLASYNSVKDEPTINDYYVINCSRDLPMVHANSERLEVDDDLSIKSMIIMTTSLPILVQTIETKINAGQKVVVHCKAGQQRSAAVVAAYVMKTMHKSVAQAISYVKSRKSDAFFWNANFESALNMYKAAMKTIST